MADDSDDDDDSFVTFGTPVEVYEEDVPRKKPVPVHEQIVTDSKGRRRFHGAFSGGFSAGYFNTVGTKEGWSPSTFVSSRTKKNEQTQQKPEDFMDDEDFSEFGIAPKNIATTSEFLATHKEQKRRLVAWEQPSGGVENVVSERKVIPGVPPLQNLVVPARMTVGVKLLKEMGWREGQGVGPRVRRTRKKIYGCAAQPMPTAHGPTNDDDDDDLYASGILFAPKDVEDFVFSLKDDFHGLGYKGIDVNTALVKNVKANNIGLSSTKNYFGKKTGIKGQAFGVGAFEEEDDDIYRTDSMSSYDMELTSESSSRVPDYHGWTGPPKQKEANGLLSIFVVATKPLPARQYFPPPVIPRHYKPSHNTQSSEKQLGVQSKKQADKTHLTVAERGRILGETPLPEPKKSVFDYVTSEDQQRLKDVQEQKQFELTKSSEVFVGPQRQAGKSTFKPFAKDALKQERYEQYLKKRAGQTDTTPLPDSGLTEWEREREKEEFARAAILYQPLSLGMAARFTSAKQPDEPNKIYEEVPAELESDVSDQAKAAAMKMFGPMTREKFEWHPDRLLCKRFNIPDPYPSSRVIGVPKVRREKFSLQDFLNVRTPNTLESRHSPEAITEKKSELSVEVPSLPTSSSGEINVPQPSKTSLEAKSSMLSLTSTDNTSGEIEKQTTDNRTDDNVLEESEPKKRPPMDLFKAIFADSSSDESKESDNEEDNAEATDENVRKEAIGTEESPLRERTTSEVASTSSSVVAQSKEVKLPLLQFIPRTKATDENVRKEAISTEESPLLERTTSEVASTSRSVVAQSKEVELPLLQFIPRTKPTSKKDELKTENEKFKKERTTSEVTSASSSVVASSKEVELPLLQFIPRTKPTSKKDELKTENEKFKKERTTSEVTSASSSVVASSKEVELPLLQFIPITKPTSKKDEFKTEKKKFNLVVDEYGPALPSNPKQATLDLSSASISKKNSNHKSDTKKHRKKKRKHKASREKERENDSSDEDDIRQVKMKDGRHWTERNITDVCPEGSDTGSVFKQNKDPFIDKYGISSLNHKSQNKGHTKGPRTPTSDDKSWKNKAEIASSKSKKDDMKYFSSDSSLELSENESSHRSTRSHLGETEKTSSADKSDSYLKEKNKKQKKRKRRHSADYHEESQLHYKVKHKKHKKEKDDKDRVPSTERTKEEPVKQVTVSDNKQILAKLKNIQHLREQKRMRAADFM